ncbi:hypothetical protein H7849_08705 [Alloacidobacterium dinghuense]|uniref:Uncharacterized protein n=1 Tax=Alloacidobacterium dinghuense TaxID=2763107 RepID=A0A7G8BN48_9BACT|nr:hypothetical protein [Alloacidobacterium dinghuense]QNI33968.1 hypothetical protein H7849_08705 [Alloacidobacterium dinghuense]
MATITMAQSTSSADSSVTVPQLVKFSGALKDHLGNARTGKIGITFALYKEQYDGAPLWLEPQVADADSEGNYSVLLGSTKPEGLPMDLFTTNEPRWLGVQIEGQAEQPRILFVSVPYALRASDAATIGGLPPSAFLRAPVQGTNRENSSSISPARATTPSTTATSGTAATPSISGSGKTDFLPIWTSPSTLGDSTVFEIGGKVGIGTTAPAFQLQVNAPNQLGEQVQGPFAGVGAGLQLQTTGAGGKGWELLATGNSSAQGPSKLNIRDLSTAADVFTIAPGGLVGINNTKPQTALQVTDNNVPCCAVGTVLAADAFKVGTAVFGDVTGTSGLARGVFGQIFSPVNDSAAVVGEAQGTSGQTSGVAGFNQSSSRFAAGIVAGEEASSGATLGVSASTSSSKGTGVLGVSVGMSNTGNNLAGCCAVGVWGDTRSNVFGDAALIGTADEARAIYLQNNSTIVPTAFMFQGAANQLTLQAGGNGGYCTIDSNGHENCQHGFSETAAVAGGQRLVSLYAMESPQHWFEDFGAGRLENGTASVALDPTFAETVNGAADYHVFLTPEGDCRGLYISRKTASGFEVRELGGGGSTVAFDYRIVALRRGSESVRMEDVTERMNNMNTSMPALVSGPRFKLPSAPPAPVVPIQANDPGATRLRAER